MAGKHKNDRRERGAWTGWEKRVEDESLRVEGTAGDGRHLLVGQRFLPHAEARDEATGVLGAIVAEERKLLGVKLELVAEQRRTTRAEPTLQANQTFTNVRTPLEQTCYARENGTAHYKSVITQFKSVLWKRGPYVQEERDGAVGGARHAELVLLASDNLLLARHARARREQLVLLIDIQTCAMDP
eukprot:2580405-Rhodomonas_salina.4